MNIRFFKIFLAVFASSLVLYGCSVKYTFTGASIPEEAKTVSIPFFPNNAAMVSPMLSTTFTEALQDKFARQTRLSVIREGGDLAFEGEIIGYTSTPAAITSLEGGREGAIKNRLTITVKVRFSNSFEPQWNFDRSFSAFLDYDSNQSLQSAEGSLIPEIVEMLVDDIFNAAVANW